MTAVVSKTGRQLQSTRQTTIELQPHQQRVVEEKILLDDKISKLGTFMDNSPLYDELSKDEKERISRQHTLMTAYSEVLGERIAAFPV
jgi:hypothetical protein